MGAGCINNENSNKRSSRKCSFKSPDKQKRLKTEPGIEDSKRDESNFENKENFLRRSKRKKIQNSSKETVESTSFDKPNTLSNDIKIVEDDKLLKGCSASLISDTLIKCLDKTLFNDNSDMTSDLIDMSKNDSVSVSTKESEIQVSNISENSQQVNLICNTTNIATEVPVSSSIQEISKFEVVKVNENGAEQISLTEKCLNHNETSPDKLKSNVKQNLQNKSQTSSMVNSDEGRKEKETDMMEAKVDGKTHEKEKTVETILNTKNEENPEKKTITVSKPHNFEIKIDKYIQSKTDITGDLGESVDTINNLNNKNGVEQTNNESILDFTKLDQLYVGIKKADTIIKELANMANGEGNFAERGNIAYTASPKEKLHSFKYESKNENSCREYGIGTSEIDPKRNGNLRNELLEPNSAILRNNCQEFGRNFQKNTEQTENHCIMKNKKTEKSVETENNYFNSVLDGNNTEVQSKILPNIDIHHVKTNPLPDRQDDKIKESALDQLSLTEQADYSITLKSEKEACLLEDTKYSYQITPDKSTITGKPIEKFHDCLNGNGNCIHTGNETEANILQDNLELKQKNLTLLYMNALDYEKENKKEILNENTNAHYDNSLVANKNNSNNDYDYITEDNVEINKYDLDNIFNKLDEQKSDTHTNLLLPSRKEKKVEKEASQQKENNECTQQNPPAIISVVNIKKDKRSQEMQGLHTFETRDDQDKAKEMKDDLSDSKKNNQIYDNQKFTTRQFDGTNTSVSQILNDELLHDNEINKAGEIKEAERCNRLHTTEPFLVTATDCFKSERKQSVTENENERIEKNDAKNLKESISPHSHVEESFDMDDDFDLTSSQIHMIDINENNHLKESSKGAINSYQQTEECSQTHFGLDSITVEIIEQLCYIRETVESIKKTLNTLLRRNEDMGKNA